MKSIIKEEKIRMQRLAGIINESIENEFMNENLLKEEKIEDFFNFLENDPKKGTFAYAYYTTPVSLNKNFIDEDGVKKPNPYYGKIFKNLRYKFSFGQVFEDAMKKKDPDYIPGERRGVYTKLTGYDVLEQGKNGLYLPIIPLEKKSKYSIREDSGEFRPVEFEEIKIYFPDRDYSKYQSAPTKYSQLVVDRIAKLSAGGHQWVNPNFIYEYLGPGFEGL